MGPNSTNKAQSAPSARAAPGRGLDRDTIVATALRFIDRDGAQGLTMRALAHELGVVPMALYRYVHGREDLLEAVIAALLEGVSRDLDDELAQDSWQGYLQTLATSVRRIATDHAAAFPLVATRHPAALGSAPPTQPRTRPAVPEHTYPARFSDTQVVDTYRAFSSFLLGQLLLRGGGTGRRDITCGGPLDEGKAQITNGDAQIDLSAMPDVARLKPLLSEDHSTDEFETALETLLDRLEMSLSQ